MALRKRLSLRPLITILAVTMMVVALACAGDDATPTSPPTATQPAPTATVPSGPTATAVAEATATPVPEVDLESLPWIERYMRSPGYKPEWGTPKTGGILKMRIPRTLTQFTPSKGTGHAALSITLYNGLIRLDPWVGWDSIIGDLAKSWELSGDGLTLTMKLEEGVKFQDNPYIPERLRNADFTCEDVDASMERSARPPKADARNITSSPSLLSNFGSVSCPDGPLGYTAVLNYAEPRGKTMAVMASNYMTILDKEYIEWLNTEHPDGMRSGSPESFRWQTGSAAFVPLEYQPDVMGKLRRNPTYFREGLPLVDGYDIYIIKDYTTAFVALATGQIHIFEHGSWAMQQGQVAQAERDFKDRIVMYPMLHNFGNGISFDLSKPPLGDRRVRQAMSLATDRDEYLLLRTAGSYHLSVLFGDLMPDTFWSTTEAELRTWPGIRQSKDQDIAEANRLLDEALGKGNRFTIPCQGTNTQDQLEICLFFKDQMKKHLNIDVKLDLMESAVNSQRSENCQTATSIGSSGGSTRIGDPDDWIFTTFHRQYLSSPGSICRSNAWFAAEPVLTLELEALGEAQSGELDPVKRREMVQKWERRHFDEMITKIGFGWTYTVPGTTTNVKGYHMFVLGAYHGIPVYERLWLAN